MKEINFEILVEGQDAFKLLPQKPPFTMVDRLFYCDEKKATAGLLVGVENPLVANGYLQEPGIMENIAQTVALKAGYETLALNKPPQIGFIAAIKDLNVFGLVPVGEMLITEIEILMSLQNMLVVNGKSYYNNIPVANCELKIFIKQ
jgi:predicted hotdog family 3-hydroxylacyl-ACP dehydratase